MNNCIILKRAVSIGLMILIIGVTITPSILGDVRKSVDMNDMYGEIYTKIKPLMNKNFQLKNLLPKNIGADPWHLENPFFDVIEF